MSLHRDVGVALGAVGLAATCIIAGYQFGVSDFESSMETADKKGFARGVQETQAEYERAANRDETLARLLAVVQSSPVRDTLTDNAKNSIDEAAKAIQRGDLAAAVDALPTGVIGQSFRDCLLLGQVALVEQGTAVTTCHSFGTTALIGLYNSRSNEVAVTIDGVTKNLLPGRSHRSDGPATCDFLFERAIETNDSHALRVSFAC